MNLHGELNKVDVPSIVELARQMPGIIHITLLAGDEKASIVDLSTSLTSIRFHVKRSTNHGTLCY